MFCESGGEGAFVEGAQLDVEPVVERAGGQHYAEAAVELTKCLMNQFSVPVANVIRHYDVTGKLCPKYYVEHPEEWERLLNYVKERL